MKKYLLLTVAVMALFTACGARQNNVKKVQPRVKTQAEVQAEQMIKIHLDSLAGELNKINPVGIVGAVKDGKIVLSDKEKLVKPTYLADPKVCSNAQTLTQKYRTIAVLCVDMEIAKLYEMPVEDYQLALAKLYADVNDPALKSFSEGLELKEAVNKFYDESVETGRTSLFWDAVTAALVEQMYVACQNTDKFITAFDDQTTSDFTWYVALLSLAVEDLANINPDYAELNETLAPLARINAITVQQFKEQLESIKDDTVKSHNTLIR